MKKLKYIIAVSIFFLLIVLNGEMYQNELDTFTSKYYFVNYEYIEGEDRKDLIDNIELVSSIYNIDVFSVLRREENINEHIITIYGSKDVYDILKKCGICEGSYKSIVSGISYVSYENFEKLIEHTYIDRFYFIGDDEIVSGAVDMLFNLQGKTRVKKEPEEIEHWVQPVIWIGLFSFLLFLTSFDIGFQKKEAFIKLSVGVSPWRIIFTNIAKDIIFYSVVFVLLNFILCKYTYIFYRLSLLAVIFIIFILINYLLYLVFLKYDLKKALSGKSITDSLRGNCYVMKIFTMILTIIVAASNAAAIKESILFISQAGIIEDYSGYSYIKEYFYYGTSREDNYFDKYMERTAQILYSEYKKGNVALSVPLMEDWRYRRYICVNENARACIKNIKELESINKSVGVHIFIPESIKNEEKEIVEFALNTAASSFYSGLKNQDYEVIKYSGRKDILYFSNELSMGSGYAENPIIIYCTFSGEIFPENPGIRENVMGIADSVMFRLSEKDIRDMEERYDLNSNGIYISSSNVKETYDYYRLQMIRALLVNTSVSGMLLFLEAIIIWVILRLEYVLNANELAIKKVLGYSVFQKNRSVILLILFSSAIGIIATIALSLMYGLALWYHAALAGVVTVLFETAAVIYFVTRIEKVAVSKILKGGSL